MQSAIESLQKRNRRVEADKAWEISKTRSIIIAVLTYCIVVIFLISLGVLHPWLNALVPVLGFLLSTLTLDYFKQIWIKHIYKK